MASLFNDNFPLIHTNKELDALKIQYPNYDSYYIASGSVPERKALFDKLYLKYEPYADSHFLREVKIHFHQRSWEMYLSCVLLENGIKITSADKGPDIKILDKERTTWIECVAPEKGCGNDRVPDLIYRVAQSVPEEEILLRLTSSLNEKFVKYKEYLRKKIINPSDDFIIAVNRGDFSHPDPTMPAILKCLFSIGNLTLPFKPGDKKPGKPFYSKQETLHKKNGSNVPMNFFEDPQHAGISAVIYSKDVVLNHPEKLGEDCILVHNPLAKNPLPEKIITFLKQYKVQGDDIINF